MVFMGKLFILILLYLKIIIKEGSIRQESILNSIFTFFFVLIQLIILFKRNSQINFSDIKFQPKILKHNISFRQKTMASHILEAQGSLEDYHIPLEYKIVDLPIIQMPQMETLKTYPCKIYRKIILNTLQNPAQVGHQWKRKCYGRIKFVKIDGIIVIAAYQYGSCHNRLRQTPYNHSTYYNLSPSQEYQNNWIYLSESQQTLSISLSEIDILDFKNEWQKAKEINSKAKQQQWLNQIQADLFK